MLKKVRDKEKLQWYAHVERISVSESVQLQVKVIRKTRTKVYY